MTALNVDLSVAAERFRQLDDFSVDIDLVALGGRPCRAILLLDDGNLEVLPSSPISGSEALESLTTGTILPIRATSILAAGTTIGACLVLW